MKVIIFMKKIILLSFTFLCLHLHAQEFIDNKGNRNQSYPSITTINSSVQNMINQVNINNLMSDIRYMQNLDIRDAQSPAALQTQNWLIDKFESFGLDVSVHHFSCPNTPANGDTLQAGNVVAIKRGTEHPNQYIIISSHYDHQSGPGADDNASGTAGVIECARIISQIQTKRTIIFVPFNAEEYWMVGSYAFAEKCAIENLNILGVFNLDMIAYFPDTISNIEMRTGYSYISKNLFDYYVQVANLYLPSIPTLQFSKGDSYGGDHMSFNAFEYPALYIGDIEYSNPCYHRPCDTLGDGANNLNLAKAFTQATIATVTELANSWLPPQNFSAISDISNVTLSWDTTPQTSKYRLYKDGLFLTETTSTSFEDFEVMENENYEYFVKAIHVETQEESAPSNVDHLFFTSPLELPYFNDFEIDSYGFAVEKKGCKWGKISGINSVFSNIAGEDQNYSDNYLNIVEMNWFPIPNNTENITLQFSYYHNIIGISSQSWNHKHTACFLEATTDRKTWHKLARFSGVSSSQKYIISLNQFIGSPFFQIRFRLESSGAWDRYYTKLMMIDDIRIDSTKISIGIQQNKPSYFKDLVISPNPAIDKIRITTFQEMPYQISVYNMAGIKILHQVSFQDGVFDLSSLSKGIYFIQVSQNGHQIAKKIIIQ